MQQPRFMTDEEKSTILSLYDEGMNTVEISKILGRNNSTIGSFLSKNGRPPRKRLKLNEQQQEQILTLYDQGMTTESIASMFSVTGNTISNVIRANKGTLRPRGHVPKIDNPSFFEVIDSESKAYFLGLIIADGSVILDAKGRKTFSLSLKSDDEHILHSLSSLLGLPEGRVTKDNRGCSGVRTSSSQIIENLSTYGVVPNKTFISYMPHVEESLLPHLIRGLFDGDGSVYVNNAKGRRPRLSVSFYGTNRICNEFKESLQSHADMSIGAKVFDKRDSNVSFITMSSKDDVRKFYEYIYSDATYYLHRKKKVFDLNLSLLD